MRRAPSRASSLERLIDDRGRWFALFGSWIRRQRKRLLWIYRLVVAVALGWQVGSCDRGKGMVGFHRGVLLLWP